MARKYIGNIQFGNTFNITSAKPIDSRMIVEFVDDLTNKETWPSDSAPAYVNMYVLVAETASMYMLKDNVMPEDGKEIFEIKENWVEISGKGGGGIANIEGDNDIEVVSDGKTQHINLMGINGGVMTALTATFKINNKVHTLSVLNEGDTIVYPYIEERAGYTFSWDDNIDVMTGESVVINGTYTPIDYRLIITLDGTEVVNEIKHVNDMIYYPTPEKGNRIEWDSKPQVMPASDITINGTTIANTYIVRYIVDGVVLKQEEKQYGDILEYPIPAEKEGHTFLGWNMDITTMPAKNITISGRYGKNTTYTIKFIIDDEIIEDTLEVGEPIVRPEVTEKEGHTWKWDDDMLITVMPEHNVTITLIREILNYTVKFIIDDSVIYESNNMYGSTIAYPEVPSKEGHTFSGWDNDITTTPNHDVTINGTYIPNKYTVTFKVDDDVVDTKEVTYGNTIIYPESPSKEGYTFNGWDNDIVTMPAHDITISGTYSINSYTLTFMLDGKEFMKETKVYSTPIAYPNVEVEESYSFSGWDNDITSMPAHDLVINGSKNHDYSIIYYTTCSIGSTLPKEHGIGFLSGGTVVDVDIVSQFYEFDVVEHTFEDGNGKIVFSEVIDHIPDNFLFFNGYEPNIETFILPEDIEWIGEGAFFYCVYLKEFNIPKTVTEIGRLALARCRNLNTLTVDTENPVYYSVDNSIIERYADYDDNGNEVIKKKLIICRGTSIPNDVNIIGSESVTNNMRITESLLELPDSVEVVETQAFRYNTRITGIKFGKNVKYIENAAIYENYTSKIVVDPENPIYDSRNNCNAVIETETNTLIVACKNTTIPRTVERIGLMAFAGAFFDNSSNYSLFIPNNVKEIESYGIQGNAYLSAITFEENSQLERINSFGISGNALVKNLVIPDSVRIIETNAFSLNRALTSITIGSGIEELRPNIFTHCTALTNIDIKDGVKKIDLTAFSQCDVLKNLVLPKSVTEIVNVASMDKNGQNQLDTISIDPENPIYDSRDNCNAIIETATNKLIFGAGNATIPNGVVEIGDYAFDRNYGIKTLIIPDSVKKIGTHAFYACQYVSTVTIGSNVEELSGTNTFYSLMSLAQITLTGKYTRIPNKCFFNCQYLQLVKIPKRITEIGDGAFQGCRSLKTIYYEGSENEWKNVQKGVDWNGGYNITVRFNQSM